MLSCDLFVILFHFRLRNKPNQHGSGRKTSDHKHVTPPVHLLPSHTLARISEQLRVHTWSAIKYQLVVKLQALCLLRVADSLILVRFSSRVGGQIFSSCKQSHFLLQIMGMCLIAHCSW
jgi:hypothetical protein